MEHGIIQFIPETGGTQVCKIGSICDKVSMPHNSKRTVAADYYVVVDWFTAESYIVDPKDIIKIYKSPSSNKQRDKAIEEYKGYLERNNISY